MMKNLLLLFPLALAACSQVDQRDIEDIKAAIQSLETKMAKIEGSAERADVAARIAVEVSLQKADRAALLVRMTPDHPEAKAIEARISELERELQKYR